MQLNRTLLSKSRHLITLSVLLVLTALSVESNAQSGFDFSISSSPSNNQELVSVSIEASATDVTSGGEFVLAVVIEHAEH